MRNEKSKCSKTLFNRLKSGDPYAFQEIYDAYLLDLIYYAFTKLDDPAEAEDVVQDAFTKLWECRKELKENTDERYLIVLVRNASISYLRKKGTFRKIKDLLKSWLPFYDEFNPVENAELGTKLEHAIAGLSDLQRECFISAYIDKKSHDKIAEALGITKQVSRNSVSIALKQLRSILKDYLK